MGDADCIMVQPLLSQGAVIPRICLSDRLASKRKRGSDKQPKFAFLLPKAPI